MKKIKKIVLAYSGGLDTSVILKWLKDKYECPVVALVADVGQKENFDAIKKRALKTGASKVIVADLKKEFVNEYVFPTLMANAVYEGKYLLATALSRPLIAKKLVEVAHKENANAVAHGCTGKGNDQVRFEVTIMAEDPAMSILAPLRDWELKSREEEIEYAKKHHIPITIKKDKIYSIDKNLWGVSIECGVLEDPWHEAPAGAYQVTTSPEKAPGKALYVEIYFDKGIPKKINGKTYEPVALIEKLNKIGGANAIGRTDLVEDRLIGIKSREIYEAPAATILHMAHRELEHLVLERDTLYYKELISSRYAQLTYTGLWFSPLKEAFDAFVSSTQKYVTGTVKVKLYKGNCIIAGRKSLYSLYNENLATYTQSDTFDHRAAKGFIDLWGLPLKVKAMAQKKRR
ncbi:MAG: argininosuccinate synthase [bacterium]